jgi:hypothetical protein
LIPPFPATLTTSAIGPTQLAVVWTLILQSEPEGPTLISCAARLPGVARYISHLLAPSWRTVVGISDREEHRSSSLAVGHASPERGRFWTAGAAGLGLAAVVRPSLISFLDQTKGDIGKQRRDHPALRRAFVRRQDEAVRQNAGIQEPPDQPVHLHVADAGADALHQLVLVDMVEAALDVAFYDPAVGRPVASAVAGLRPRSHGHADVLQGAVAASSGPEPVRYVPEGRLEDRLQKVLHRALYDAVAYGRDAQGAKLPWFARFGDELPAGRARLV